MSTSVTIRNVPEETHAELVARAELSGQSLQEYLRSRLIEIAKRPDPETFWNRVRARKKKAGTHLSIEQILEHKDADRE